MATMKQVLAATPGFPRQLSWDDYQKVDESRLPPFEAVTVSGFKIDHWGLTHGTAPNEHRGSVFFDPLKVHATFDSTSSWVLKSSLTKKWLLAHEQGHFDINGLIARDLATNLLALRVYGNEARSANSLKAGDTAMLKKGKHAEDRAKALYDFLQGLYDSDTNHGMDERGQADWNKLLHHVKIHAAGFEDTLVKRGFFTILSDPPAGTPTFGSL